MGTTEKNWRTPRLVPVGDFRATPKMYELVNQVLSSGRISYGKMSQELEHRFAQLHGCKYAVLSNSGTSALHIALQAMKELHGWNDWDGVIVPATTFVATANIVHHCRMRPIFADVDSRTFNIDPARVADILDYEFVEDWPNNIRAIIPVHLLGLPADMRSINAAAKLNDLKVIEDACFTGNTLIPTKNGVKRIRDIAIGDRLLGFDGISFKETKVVGTNNRLVNYKDILVIKFDNGLTVRCTTDHPFYVNRQWVKAIDLKVNDEIWHCNWSEYVTWRREFALSAQGKNILSQNMKVNNPMRDPQIRHKTMKQRKNGASRLEKKISKICTEYNFPIQYVGDGIIKIGSEQTGFKNPDFIVNGTNKVIELFDPTFKYHKNKNVIFSRDGKWKKERYDFYQQFGYQCYFLEVQPNHINRNERIKIANRLREIVSNGIRIVSIKKATAGYARIYNLPGIENKGAVRVYNLHCEPHNNFILTGGVLVHNCETMFVKLHGQPVGSLGDIGCFSFYIAHLLVAGVGGISTTNNPDYAARMRSLCNHGLRIDFLNPDQNFAPQPMVGRRFLFSSRGHSFRLTEFEAAIALAQLDDYQEMLKIRQRNVHHLISGLERLINQNYNSPLVIPDLPHIENPALMQNAWMMFPVVLKPDKEGHPSDKEPLMKFLNEHMIETRDIPSLIPHPCYQNEFSNAEGDFPVSHWLWKSGFYIGCGPTIPPEDIDYVIQTFEDYYSQKELP